MPEWMHARAEHILAKNPSMSKGEAFAIATQQMHSLGKTPKGYGTAEGKAVAKEKYDTPKDDKKTANPGHLESVKMSAMATQLGQLARRAANPAIMGAALGGVSGAVSSNPEHHVGGALKGALLGGALGGAGAIGKGISAAGAPVAAAAEKAMIPAPRSGFTAPLSHAPPSMVAREAMAAHPSAPVSSGVRSVAPSATPAPAPSAPAPSARAPVSSPSVFAPTIHSRGSSPSVFAQTVHSQGQPAPTPNLPPTMSSTTLPRGNQNATAPGYGAGGPPSHLLNHATPAPASHAPPVMDDLMRMRADNATMLQGAGHEASFNNRPEMKTFFGGQSMQDAVRSSPMVQQHGIAPHNAHFMAESSRSFPRAVAGFNEQTGAPLRIGPVESGEGAVRRLMRKQAALELLSPELRGLVEGLGPNFDAAIEKHAQALPELTKIANFAVSQYSGDLGPVGGPPYASGIPPFRVQPFQKPKEKRAEYAGEHANRFIAEHPYLWAGTGAIAGASGGGSAAWLAGRHPAVGAVPGALLLGALHYAAAKKRKEIFDKEKTAGVPLSPASRLSSTQHVGAPKITAPSGPSIAEISKPHGYGMPLAGATKTAIAAPALSPVM